MRAISKLLRAKQAYCLFFLLARTALPVGYSGEKPPKPEFAELVCVGCARDVRLTSRDTSLGTFSRTVSVPFSVSLVLKGDLNLAGRPITITSESRFSGPLLPGFYPEKGRNYLLWLSPKGDTYRFMGRGCLVGQADLMLPPDATFQERVALTLISSIRDRDSEVASSALSGLVDWIDTTPSPHYDLLSEFLKFAKGHALEGKVIRGRLKLGDQTALPRAFELAKSDGPMSCVIPPYLETLGDDGVTTLCLIAEGKLLPGRQEIAVKSLRRMAPPKALPTLVKCLDSSNASTRYVAYTAIEKIKGQGNRITNVYMFLGVPRTETLVALDHHTSHSQNLIRQMKQWWETEGKKQFDYVLPEEK